MSTIAELQDQSNKLGGALNSFSEMLKVCELAASGDKKNEVDMYTVLSVLRDMFCSAETSHDELDRLVRRLA
jgi:hypothetical protein